MTRIISFKGEVERFPSPGGWYFIAVPKDYVGHLKQQRKAWGMFPITVSLNGTTWKTKLMMKKGGVFFVALKAAIREKEEISLGDRIKISFRLDQSQV